MFLCQGFRKYLPEVKKESARRSSTQSSEPRPKSPSERASQQGHVAVASAARARFMPRCSRTTFLG